MRSFKVIEEILDTVSVKMDVKLTLVSMPAKRSQVLLNKGLIVGEIARGKGYQKEVPNAIRIERPVITLPIHAYTTTLEFDIDGWNSIRNYSIVILRGVHFDTKLEEFDINYVNSNTIGFHFLEAKRADIFAVDLIGALAILEEIDPKGAKFKRLEPALEYTAKYAYISDKYAYLADKLNNTLNEIIKDGTMYKMIRKLVL